MKPQWRRSTASGGTGGSECVEAGQGGAAVGVRGSQDRAGAQLTFGPAAWRAFTALLKTGGTLRLGHQPPRRAGQPRPPCADREQVRLPGL